MKIGFIRHSILNRGGDAVTLAYAGYLAEDGHDVTVWTNKVDTVFPISPLIKVIRLPLRTKAGTLLCALFGKFPCDILIADIIALVFPLSLRNRASTIYFAQDYDESYYRFKFMRLIVRLLYTLALRLKKIPAIAVSPDLAHELHFRFKADVQVVPNGVDHTLFYRDLDPEILRKKGAKKSVLVFARKDRRKGLDIALGVLREAVLAGYGDDLIVWVIGDRVNGFPEGLVLEKFGFVGKDLLRKILSSSDVFLFPSRHEGFPLLVLQALACGCPVLTTSAVTIVEDELDALVASVEDQEGLTKNLLRLLDDADLGGSLRAEGYKTAARYDLCASKSAFQSAILGICSQRHQNSP